jgi:hypothetical protein
VTESRSLEIDGGYSIRDRNKNPYKMLIGRDDIMNLGIGRMLILSRPCRNIFED